MKIRPIALAVSVAVPALFGARNLLGIPAELAAIDHSAPLDPFRLGAILGVATSSFFWFTLAFGQWRTRGQWGIAVAIAGFISIVAQSALFYLAVSSGRVAPTPGVIAHFALFAALPSWALVGAGFLTHLKNPPSIRMDQAIERRRIPGK